MRIIVADPTRNIILGRPGENEVIEVRFPIKDWIESLGTSGTFGLVHKRQGDTDVYPCNITWNTDYVSWVVTNSDNAIVGTGKAVLSYYIDNQIRKSKTFDTITMDTIEIPENVPEPYQSWVDALIEATSVDVEAAKQSAEDAEAYSVGTRDGVPVDPYDPAYENNAKYYVEEIISNRPDWEQTDPDALDYIKNKPIIPEVKYEELNRNGILLKYNYQQISDMWQSGTPMCFQKNPVIKIVATAGPPTYFNLYMFSVSYNPTTRKSTYEIIEQQCYDDGPYARIGSSQVVAIAPIQSVKKADGTALQILDSAVTLPDYALASALTNYYLKTETYSKTEVNNLIPTDNAQLTNGAGYITQNDVVYTEIFDSLVPNTNPQQYKLKYTFAEIKTMYETGVPMRFYCSGSITVENYRGEVVGVKQGTTNIPHRIFFNGRNNERRYTLLIPYEAQEQDVATEITVGGYVLASSEYDKLTGGAVASGNNSFVTGDQVYQAIQNALNNL